MSYYLDMFAEYVSEREGKKVLTHHDKGFLVYRYEEIENEKCCYISDIFVKKEYRRQGVASEMMKYLEDMAKLESCNFLIGGVQPLSKMGNESLKAWLKYGFEVSNTDIDLIVLKKGL